MGDLKTAKTSYVTEVYQKIHALILNGEWKTGDKLPTEHQLAAQFHVSRVVVREALQQLRTEHLIVTRHGSGSFVAKPQDFAVLPYLFASNIDLNLTDDEFQDLMDLRTCIEFRAMELAAKRATKEDLALGLVNMVFESVAMLAIFAARNKKLQNIVVTGNMTNIPQAKEILTTLNNTFETTFLLPEHAQYATVIGAALSELKRRGIHACERIQT